MKRIRLDRWAIQLQPPRNPRLHLHQQTCPFSHEARAAPRRQIQQRQYQVQRQWQCQRRSAASRRKASSAAVAQVEEVEESPSQTQPDPPTTEEQPLNFPHHKVAIRSAKLSALHSRLSLPTNLPLQTLARCLIDPSVDGRPGYHNGPLALLGQDILGYYTAEWLLCHYPRLPMPVLFAAQYAYVGEKTLAAMRGEWGIEVVAAPGPEVDAGLLQLRRITPGNALAEDGMMRLKDMPQARRLGGSRLGRSGRSNEEWNYRRGISSRIVYDDQFGDLQTSLPPSDSRPYIGAPMSTPADGTTYPLEGVEDGSQPSVPSAISRLDDQDTQQHASPDANTVESASAGFIRALTGALYLHSGPTNTKTFHKNHILSRHLPLHTLFNFTHPTRDLSRLCAREGFEPPVARLISETGRLSRTPVFVVGVYSGADKLGEGAGSSLNEGRVRAAAAALRGWYLYSPAGEGVMLPSEVEGKDSRKTWKPQLIDIGEIVT